MASKVVRDALAVKGLVEIRALDGRNDPGVDRAAAEVALRAARKARDGVWRDHPEVEVMFVIGDSAVELGQPPSLAPLLSADPERPVVGPNRHGYPVAWMRRTGQRDDGTIFTFFELSWPHAHIGEKRDRFGDLVCPVGLVIYPLQVDVAIQGRHREVRAALGRPGGPLSGHVENGALVKPVADEAFDAATAELWQRHKCGEWVGQNASNMFFVSSAAQVCGRSAADLGPLMDRLQHAQIASRYGNTLVAWKPPLADPRPSLVVDTIALPDREVTIFLPNDRRERDAWRITITDAAGSVEHEELIGLKHEPTFGPDVSDVWVLEARLQELLGPAYPPERTP